MVVPQRTVAVAVLGALLCTAGVARGDVDYFTTASDPDDITFRVDKKRSPKEWIVIGSLAGGAIALAGVGLYFHLDYDSRATDIEFEANQPHLEYDPVTMRQVLVNSNGLIWSAGRQEKYDRSLVSRNLAVVAYSMAGTALLSTLVAYIVTDPGKETVTIGKSRQARSFVAPIDGGAVVGSGWSF